jgi:hypothetical protein
MTAHNTYLKRREMLVLGIEATRGTIATQQYSYRWLTKDIKTIPGILENESGIGGDDGVNDSAIDVVSAEGPIGGKVTEDGIGYLNLGLLNKVTSSAPVGGLITHHFEYDKSIEPKSFSMWDVRPSNTRLFKSVVFDNLEISVEAGEKGAWLEANAVVKGWGHTIVTGVTPAFIAEKEFTSRHVKVYLAADLAGLSNLTTSRVKARSIKLSMAQPQTADHSVGDGDTPEFDKGRREVKGEMVVKYRKTDFEDDYFNNAVHAMRISIQNGSTVLTYTATKVRFRELTDSGDKDTVVTQSISFYCEADDANNGHAIVSDLTNTITAYTA